MKHGDHDANAERADWVTLHQQLTIIGANSTLQESVHSAPEPVLVLNTHRQIVYANAASQALLAPGKDPATLYACRLGEVIHCVHANTGGDGCGTSPDCHICGALNAVLASLKGKADMQQCSIDIELQAEPMEFILLSVPLLIDNERFALVTMIQREDEDHLANHAFSIQRMTAEIESC